MDNFEEFLSRTNNLYGYNVTPIMTMANCHLHGMTPLNFQILHNHIIFTDPKLVKYPRKYCQINETLDIPILDASIIGATSVNVQDINDPALLDYCSRHKFALNLETTMYGKYLSVRLTFFPQSLLDETDLQQMNARVIDQAREMAKIP